MRASVAAILLCFSILSFPESQVSFSVVVLNANTTLAQGAVPASLPGPGNASFTCNYRYSEGAVFNGKCVVVVDGNRLDAFPPSFSRSAFLSTGTHAWHCECSGTGFQEQAGSPVSFEVGSLPAAPSPSPQEMQLALQVVVEANNSVAQASSKGLETSEAEGFLKLASLALAQNDTARASSFASTAKRLSSSAPPKSVLAFVNSLGWAAPVAGFAALAIVFASFHFFRTYFRKKEQ